jgi:spermidine synthase
MQETRAAGCNSSPKLLYCAGMKSTDLISLVAAALLFPAFQPACRVPPAGRARMEVVDTEQGRKLFIGGRLRALVDTATWESRLKYVAVMNLPMRFSSKPGTMLLIGLGGGSIARNYGKSGWRVEAVEPDSAIAGIARNSFGLRAENVALHASGGREFLSSHPDRYDVILEDLVALREVPANLVTSEFFASAGLHLNEGGVFGIAFECAGWRDEIVRMVVATLSEKFPEVVVLPIAEPPNRFGTIVVLASTSPHSDLARDVDRNSGLDPEWRFGPGYQETHAWDNRFSLAQEPGLIQSDARNRIEKMFESIDDSSLAQPADYLP